MNMKGETSSLPLEANSLLMLRRAQTFAWAAQFLSRPIRNDLNELYTFCRFVDDCVDKSTDGTTAQKAIASIRRDLEQESSSIKEVDIFLKLAHRRKIPLGFALDLVRGVESDIGSARMSDEEDLLRYCYQVAGTVGVMICYLLGVRDPNAIASGIDLGIAMQLTNIARDVQEDYAQGRVYLPSCLIDRDSIAASQDGDKCAQAKLLGAVEQIVSIAETYYISSENGICFLPGSAKVGILAASRAYRKIGKLILGNPDRYLHTRASTSGLQKALCLASALASLCLPRFHCAPSSQSHRRELHRALRGLPSFDVVYP
jgi:phytoene synthase